MATVSTKSVKRLRLNYFIAGNQFCQVKALIFISCLYSFSDARYDFLPHGRASRPRLTRSQTEQRKGILPSTKQLSYKWSSSINSRRGLDPQIGKAWNSRPLLTNHPYLNAYQKSVNQPLSYFKQIYWPRKGYQPNLWNNVPIDDVPVSLYDKPTVQQAYSLWGNAKSRHILPHPAGFRSSVDEDQTLVEGRIQEYYDQRLNKNRNKWMFKPVQGTTPHIKEIFLGRCWDFVANKGKYIQDSSEVDCQELWETFHKSFAFKEPCTVTTDDYAPFFNMYKEKPLNDRVYHLFIL